MTQDLDIAVFGATGFVGRLTAEYLAEHAPPEVRIGLAGRSQAKLADVRAKLPARAADWPLVVADSADAASLDRLAGGTRVVATTVGPYHRAGMPLVGACARAGTHYADLTGEPLFMRESIDAHHAAAESSGARIVHTCGFDSIPSDLGVLLLHAAADGEGLEDTTFVLTDMRGGVSGGTLASMKGQLDAVREDRALERVLADPYALSPDRAAEPDLGAQHGVRGVEHDEQLGMWLAPFVMAAVNTRVVRRSNALQDWAYGRRLRYREAMRAPGGPAAPLVGLGIAGAMAAFEAGMGFGPTRAVLDRILPSAGEGPGERTRRTGGFKIEIHTRTESGRRLVCRIAAKGDPGYAATAVMLGESALCLALDQDRLPPRAGVLTPASAVGTALADRLRAAGQSYDVAPAA